MNVYGGIGNEGGHALPTWDKGYIMFGYTFNNPNPNNDMLLIRTDSLGDTLWTKMYTGANGGVGPWDISLTRDSGFMLEGAIVDSSFFQPTQSLIIRLDKNGDTLWTKGGLGAGYAVETADGGFVLYCNLQISKFDVNGNLQWKKYYSGIGAGSPRLRQTSDGGYILCGETDTYSTGGPSDRDIFLIKLDSLGNVEWEKAYGGMQYETASTSIETFAGDFVVLGVTQSFGAGGQDIILMKVDMNGDTLWTKTMGGVNTEYIGDVVETAGSLGYLVAGSTYGFGTDDSLNLGQRACVIRTDYYGNVIWANRYGEGPVDCGQRIVRTSDNGMVLSGFTGGWGAGLTDMWLVKSDVNGDVGCYDYPTIPIVTTPPINVRNGSCTVINSTATPYYVPVKITRNTQITVTKVCPFVSSGIEELTEVNSISVYPNPANTMINIDWKGDQEDAKVWICNSLGEVVYNGTGSSIDIHSLKTGIYLVGVRFKNSKVMTRKFIKE